MNDFKLEDATYPDWEIKRRRDRLLVVGTGRRVWEDVELSGWDRGLGLDIMCVKDTLVHFPGNVDHAFSEHPDQLRLLSQLRRARRKIMAKQERSVCLHSSHEGDSYIHNWNIPRFGCSGMGATIIGVLLGYHQIVLAGIHLDDSGHYYDPHWVKTSFGRQYLDKDDAPRLWSDMEKHYFKGKVKALSGRLKEYLGGP